MLTVGVVQVAFQGHPKVSASTRLNGLETRPRVTRGLHRSGTCGAPHACMQVVRPITGRAVHSLSRPNSGHSSLETLVTTGRGRSRSQRLLAPKLLP